MDRSRPLRVTLPDGRQALSAEDERGTAVGFAATQPLQRCDVGVTVCLNGPPERTVAPVRDILRETFAEGQSQE
ncbi:hypothetical protein [Streptomyces sp. NPDC001020]